MPTRKEIEAAKTPKGGWTKAQMTAWGVPWPPAEGWKDRLVAGEYGPLPMSEIRTDVTADDLLRKVVGAVISAGHASDLYEYPDVLAYFGARIPEPEEISDHHPGSIAKR